MPKINTPDRKKYRNLANSIFGITTIFLLLGFIPRKVEAYPCPKCNFGYSNPQGKEATVSIFLTIQKTNPPGYSVIDTLEGNVPIDKVPVGDGQRKNFPIFIPNPPSDDRIPRPAGPFTDVLFEIDDPGVITSTHIGFISGLSGSFFRVCQVFCVKGKFREETFLQIQWQIGSVRPSSHELALSIS